MRSEDFHRLARAVSTEDTLHMGYTMNWPVYTKGASIVDYATSLPHRQAFLEAGRQAVEELYKLTGCGEYLVSPPVDNVREAGGGRMLAAQLPALLCSSCWLLHSYLCGGEEEELLFSSSPAASFFSTGAEHRRLCDPRQHSQVVRDTSTA